MRRAVRRLDMADIGDVVADNHLTAAGTIEIADDLQPFRDCHRSPPYDVARAQNAIAAPVNLRSKRYNAFCMPVNLSRSLGEAKTLNCNFQWLNGAQISGAAVDLRRLSSPLRLCRRALEAALAPMMESGGWRENSLSA